MGQVEHIEVTGNTTYGPQGTYRQYGNTLYGPQGTYRQYGNTIYGP